MIWWRALWQILFLRVATKSSLTTAFAKMVQNGCEQIEESERRPVEDCKGHRTQEHPVIKRLRRGKWRRTATAFVCHFRESWPTIAACVFSSISSTVESANAIATDFDTQLAFGLSQSSTSLNPTMMIAQEQNLLNTFNYCQVSFNLKNCKSSRPAIPSVKPIKRRRVHIIESYSDSD